MKLALLFLVLGFPGFANEKGFTVSAIPQGATLKVEYSSTGCFHQSTTWFEFRDGKVKVWDRERVVEGDKVEWKRNFVGEKALTEKEVEGLDVLFDYYQTGPDGGCTTVDRIEMKLMEGERVVREEDHVDGSCRVNEVKDVLTFYELMQRVAKPAAKQGE